MKVTFRRLVYLELIYTVFMMQWMTYFGISNVKVLIPDAINVVIFLADYKFLMRSWSDKKIRSITICVALFWFTTFFASLFGEMVVGGSKGIILALWNMRTFMRPFFYMLLCYTYFDKFDLEKIYKIAYRLQFVNVAFTLFQYYVQHIWMDQNGGIFAPVQGCNKYTNVYCCIMITWVIARYLKDKGSVRQIAFTLIASIISAIYSELKFIFIEMIIVILLCILFSGGGKKIVRTIIMGISVLFIGLLLLSNLFPETFKFLTDYELFMWYARDMSYSQSEVSVNRLSGFSIVNEYMFKGDLFKKMFGFGWGATGQIPFLSIYAPVMLAYQTLSYATFTYSWIYAELGILGLILFYGIFFVIIGAISKNSDVNSEYTIISKIMCIVTVMLTVYDSSWITEGTSFMCALVIMAGLIATKRVKEYD